MPITQRISRVVAVISLGVLAAGCGVSEGASAPEAISAGLGRAPSAVQLAQAAEATAEATTYQVWLEVEAAADVLPFTVTAEGAFDAEAGRGRIATTMAGADGLFDDLGTTEVIYDGDAAYLRAPFVEMVNDGKPWVRVPVEELADQADALDLGGADQATGLLELLEQVGEVEEVGVDTVRGVPTRHVRAEVEIGRAIDQADPEDADAIRARFEAMGVDVDALSTLPVDVWVGDDGFVRRFAMTVDFAAFADDFDGEVPAELADSTITQTLELYGFGEPVDIEVPPADQVGEIDLESLLGD